MKLYRQGDILLTKIEELPEGLTSRHSLVIAEGEATGHQHSLVAGKVLQDALGALYLAVFQSTQVVHQEHHPISLEPGYYRVIRQREYVAPDIDRTGRKINETGRKIDGTVWEIAGRTVLD